MANSLSRITARQTTLAANYATALNPVIVANWQS